MLTSRELVRRVRPAGRTLTVYNLDAFLARVDASRPPIGGLVQIDLRGLDFIDLFAMVGLAFLCGDLCDSGGCRVSLQLGEGDGCGFLARAGFFDILPSVVVELCDLPPARLSYMRLFYGSNRALLEFTRLDSYQTVREVLNRVKHTLQRQLKYSHDDARRLTMMLSEVCHNVLDHHDDPRGADGVVAMQVHGKGTDRFVQVVVGDRGRGIRGTLSRHRDHADLMSDVEAIGRSVEPGTSEYDDPTHGTGLYHLLRLARLHGGTVHIRSGSGKLYSRAGHAEAMLLTVPTLGGTQFSLAFPAKSLPVAIRS